MSYTDSRTITDDEFDRMIKINLKAPIRIMKAVLYEMESQGSGSIINIGSRMVKKLRLLKGGSVPTFVGLGPVLHNKLAVDA